MAIETLKRRSEFLRVRGGGRHATPAFVVEGKARPADRAPAVAGPRFGFTVTKQIGNAVTRNRAKRRLRAAVAKVVVGVPDKLTRADFDYVVIARDAALDLPFDALYAAMATAIERVHKPHSQSRRRT